VDVLCLSHLRWDFVYQRPNHLMSRASSDHRVFFVEEPRFGTVARPTLELARRKAVTVVVPHLPDGWEGEAATRGLRMLIDELVDREFIDHPILWYYTPISLPWTRHIAASITVFDSMDDLSVFAGAPTGLRHLEAELLQRSDLVFTGGVQLQKRMADRHPAAHCFPSGVDVAHFGKARAVQPDPADQASMPRPRIGYAGVLDERIDLSLISDLAVQRPDWQIVLLGPVAKIDPATVPSGPNIHRLGLKAYEELPRYLSSWDVGWMPFARNDATRAISPTKTPEYLAAGLPVVSTSIADVIDPYERNGLVAIADDVDTTIEAIQRALASDVAEDRKRADAFLSSRSWDAAWAAMQGLIDAALREPETRRSHGSIDSGSRVRPVLESEAVGHGL
jgi:glycosyltransferase involved in cell wall biosynthesis